MHQQIPVIYFLGTSPGRYQPIISTFIVGWHPERLRVDLAFGVIVGASAQATLPASPERRYALREIKVRLLHQASFRDAVLSAYGGRCAISQLPEPRLLDAAHIVVDADEQLGQPIVPNGLPLTKIHHAAFDAHLIGIDPDFQIHVSDRLLEIHDGPFLELGLKGIAGTMIDRPNRIEDRPVRDRLALRFEQFKKAAWFRSYQGDAGRRDGGCCDKDGAPPWSTPSRRSTASTTIRSGQVEQPQSPQVTA
jgi:putative restriction endonuclease